MKIVTISGEQHILGKNAAMRLMLQKHAAERHRASYPQFWPFYVRGYIKVRLALQCVAEHFRIGHGKAKSANSQ